MIVGGHSDSRDPTDDERDLLEADTLRTSIQGVSCDTYASIEVVSIKTQVVAGTVYTVKYRVIGADEVFVDHEGTHVHGSAGSIIHNDGTVVEHGDSVSYIHVKIFAPLPHMNALPEVQALQKLQVTEDSPLELIESLLHSEECPEPEPEQPVTPEPEEPVTPEPQPVTPEP